MPDPVRVIGLGAGGHAKVVLEALAALGGYEVVGLLDPREELWGRMVGRARVLGGDDLLAPQYDDGVTHAFIGLGGAAGTRPRQRLYELARERGFDVPSIVDPSAVVSSSARIGDGATILPRAVVNAGAELGENVIVNSGAIVEHDCRLGDHCHIASGATLTSGVEVGSGAHVGAGATVRQGISIGAGAVVGIGAAVVSDVEAHVVVAGVPAAVMRAVEG